MTGRRARWHLAKIWTGRIRTPVLMSRPIVCRDAVVMILVAVRVKHRFGV